MAQALKVGIFATICLIILALFIWKIEDLNPFKAKGERLKAVFDSVAGLDDKAAVRVAGVRVGRVDGIGLSDADTKARVTILLEKTLPLKQGTYARVSNLGLLGEKYIEIIPGPPGGPPLDTSIPLVGETPPSFDDTMAKLNKIGDSVQQVAGSLAGGDLGGNINRLVASVQATSDEIRFLVMENRAGLRSTVDNANAASATLARELPRLSEQMSHTLSQIETILSENRANVSGTTANAREVTAKLETSADNLNKISDKIAKGEGTIGKLVNSDEAYKEVVSTLDSIQGGVKSLSDTLGAANKFKIDLDMQGYELPSQHGSQSGLHVDINPQDNLHLYRVGFASTPQGKHFEKDQTITVTQPDGTSTTTKIVNVSQEQSYVVDALFGYKGPRDLRLFAGLIESSGGAEVDYPLLNNKFLLSFQAFDFNRPNDQKAHLRLSGRWQFHPNLYLIGGYDDPLEKHSFFLGGGIRWNDDNLKYLLGAVGKL
jgi:phospholipid/cholesterol/gamma-HCH transport system substrate-binding protein